MTQPLPEHVQAFLDAAKAQSQYALDQAQLALTGAQAEAARDFHAEADELQADADAKVAHAQELVTNAEADLAFWSDQSDAAVSEAYNAAPVFGPRNDTATPPAHASGAADTSGA